MTLRASIAPALFSMILAGMGVGVGVLGAGAAAASADEPAPETIVDVTGDQANGFAIHHYDGSVDYPPTRSESRAECNEYDTRVARVRCRTEVRVWFRDLADLQQALDHAHATS